MANLQYIGARYVPKFYLNPDYPAGDTRTNDWKSGVDYEALTIVTYNNDSYTSKKPVPDTIGDPLDNPDYWACTTKYTAALMALQTTVGLIDSFVNIDSLDTVAQTVSGAINEIQSNIVDLTLLKENYGWWTIKSLLNLGKIGEISGIEVPAVSNLEDVTFNPNTGKLYAIDNLNTVYIIDVNSLTIDSTVTLNFVAGSASGIDYNPDDDEFYVSSYDSGTWKCYRVNGTTFANLGLTSANGHLFYDAKLKCPVAFIGNNNVATIVIYDKYFVVQTTKTISYDTFGANGILTQSGCAYDGIIYSANRDTLVQIDYQTGRSHSLQTVGQHWGDREIEGFYVINDVVYMAARVNMPSGQTQFDELFINGSIQSENPNSLYQDYINEQRVYNYAGGKALETGDDLNNITYIGNYYCYQTTINTTLQNKPAALANRPFKMRVEYANAASVQRVQIITEGTRPVEYRRYFDSSTLVFGDWIETMRDVGTLGGLQYDFARLSTGSGQSIDLTMNNTIALVICSRDNYSDIFIVDYWNATPHKLQAGTNTDRITFTKNANELTCTITNNISSSTDIMIIGGRLSNQQ